ncbi:MAG: insulinase family protein [Gammaproteobacteria bacterium]|nr:insulinase family protein [Gammaproteobacteria bacterium]
MRSHWLIPAILAAAVAAGETVSPVQPVKSPIDDREYRRVVLPNNLRALLMHDPGSDRAFTAASVARGSNQDPKGHEGLAHLVEHLLFVATDKYPEVDGFRDFLRDHDGRAAGFTASDRTIFGFQLYADHLPEALDRFAQFFIAPLFEPDHIEREKQAVDKENHRRRWEEDWQEIAVSRQTTNPEHPLSRFRTGNLETLSGVGGPEVRAFFEANYSADTITLAVLGPHDLDMLEALVRERFGMIVDRGLGSRPSNPTVFRPGTLPGSYTWRNFSERNLGLTFSIPPLKPHYRTKPTRYLAGLVGNESPGSLHDILNRRGWIRELEVKDRAIDEQNSLFGISMELTEVGEPHVQEIVDLTYAWIDLIRREGVDAWRYHEEARLADIDFRFHNLTTPAETVIYAADALANYPPEDVLRHSHMMDRFDASLIRRYLDFLTPKNALVSISGPIVDVDYAGSLDEPALRWGPALLPQEIDAPFELPGPNAFIPNDLDLLLEPGPPGKPVRLETGTAVETWHAPDTEFRTPTVRVELRLRPAEPFTPDDIVLATLHAKLVEHALHARTHAARRAGLTHGVNSTWTGLRIHVGGYHDKLTVLFDDMLKTFVALPVDAERFTLEQTDLIKTHVHRERTEPLRDTVHYLLHPEMWPTDVLVEAARRATPATLATWRKQRLTGMGATLLVHGNLLGEDAQSLATLVQRRLGIVELAHVRPTARRLAGSLRYEHSIEFRDDTDYALYVQGESDAIEERASISLIGHMLNDRYYTALTADDEQTYVASASTLSIAGIAGIMFLQFSKTGAEELERRTRAFLDEQRAWFRDLSAADLQEHKRRCIATLPPPDRNNSDRVARLARNLTARVLTFDERDQFVRAVKRLTPAEVADTYDALIAPSRGNRLTVYSPGPAGTVPQDGTMVSSRKELIQLTSAKADP